MKVKSKILAVIISISLVALSMEACGSSKADETVPVSPESVKAESVEFSKETPVTISVIEATEPDEKETFMSQEIDETHPDVKGMVTKAVKYDLEDRGFCTADSIAFSSDKTFREAGVGYYNPDFKLFNNEEYTGKGFVTVIGPEDKYQRIPEDSEYIAVESLEKADEESYSLLAYTCDSINSAHFIYQNKYVIYYQLDSTTVKYEIFDNDKKNYNLSLGSLYDFDNGTYIYNAALFEDYEKHSGIELYQDINYEELEQSLQALAKEQERNGYYVEELNIVYISPESIEAYLASEEKDTFFGYSVADLENSLGKGTALVYTKDGFQTAEFFAEEPENYNWKSFLTKVGIGTGIIITGAVLTPVTGGASFGCALITIVQVSGGMALSQGLGTLAIETVKNLMQGYDFKTAVTHASGKGLDGLANGFMIGAVVGSVGVVSGIIKPVACFVKGTVVAVPSQCKESDIAFKPIEKLRPGDAILSYDESSKSLEIDHVTEIIERTETEFVDLEINGNTIRSTTDHPYYNPIMECWISAGSLESGDYVLSVDELKKVSLKKIFTLESTKVFNLTTDKNHTYFVGYESVLVHNECTTLKAARQKGVDKAWENEVKAVQEGKSKYNWTETELDELLTNGKVKGYEGCHIRDVSLNPELADKPENIILLKHEVHFRIVHNGNWNNPSQWGEIVKIMPQFKEQVLAVGGLL